jgi:cation transporter-like permease
VIPAQRSITSRLGAAFSCAVHVNDKPDRKKWSWGARAIAAFLALVIYALSTGPMAYVVAKLNGGNHTVTGYLRFLVMPYRPLYWTLNYMPKPIRHAWEKYDTFFWDLATKP